MAISLGFPILMILSLLVAGIALLRRGLIGRTIDEHPVCRKCGFDLFGLPAGAGKCSECGADLSLARAVRIGNRRKRPGMAALGAMLLLPAVLAIGLLIFVAAREIRWIQYTPTWYVLRESNSTTPADRDPAINELLRRLSADELSDEQVARIADTQLKWQADANVPWSAGRGDLIDMVRGKGKLSDEKWAQYLTTAVHFKLVARPEVRRGDNLPTRIEHSSPRAGSRTQFYLVTETSLQPSDLVSPTKNRIGGRNGSSSGGTGSHGSTGRDIILDPKLVAGAPDGTKTLRMKLKVDLSNRQGSGEKTPPLASKTFDLQTTWDLVPADAPTVKAVEDPAATAAVEKATTINSITVRGSDADYVSVSINFNNTPVPLASKIILRSGGREWPAGHIYVKKGGNSGWGTGAQVKNFDANIVDVILRADEKTALNTIDMREYWTGEAVIKNVKVTRTKQ